MPQPVNKTLRFLVPFVLGVLGIVLFYPSVKRAIMGKPATPTTMPAAQTAPGEAPKSGAPANPVSEAASSREPTPSQSPVVGEAAPAPTPASSPAAGGVVSAGAFQAEVFPSASVALPLGSDDPTGAYWLKVEFSGLGAGVKRIVLSRHFETIQKLDHITLQGEDRVADAALTPFAALAVSVNGQAIALAGSEAFPVWREVSGKPGVFEAFIKDSGGSRVLRLERAYGLREGSYELTLDQSVTNLSGSALRVTFYQIGPVDPPKDVLAYVGDRRRYRFGYLLSPQKDPAQASVMSDAYVLQHSDVLGKRQADGHYLAELAQWPNEISAKEAFTLSWAGVSNRYFGVAAHPRLNGGAAASKSFAWVGGVNRVVLEATEKVALRLDSRAFDLAPGGSADLSMAVFAGPLDKDLIELDADAKALGISGLIYHNMGGPCGFCTFSPLTGGLLWLLQTLHKYVVFDWGLAVIALVVIVRTILHPVTKWSQTRMTRFGKQMAALGPKQKALQEKYKDDPKKLQSEQMKLWRDEGVSPTGMLGCVPMFLQMPVWFALYATLFFAVELRHQPAFFGVFQTLGHSWLMADMSEPDRFVYFGRSFHVPLLSSLMGPISSLNILPLILGVVFFIQQKYLTPPSTATLTPEQEMQQKMIKWMSVIMFPLFMYNAPCGLTLYFATNSAFAIVESKRIRRHIEEEDKKNPPGAKKGPKAKGFMERVMEAAEARKRMMEEGSSGRQNVRRR